MQLYQINSWEGWCTKNKNFSFPIKSSFTVPHFLLCTLLRDNWLYCGFKEWAVGARAVYSLKPHYAQIAKLLVPFEALLLPISPGKVEEGEKKWAENQEEKLRLKVDKISQISRMKLCVQCKYNIKLFLSFYFQFSSKILNSVNFGNSIGVF